MILIW
jgi:hypothetical protein